MFESAVLEVINLYPTKLLQFEGEVDFQILVETY